MSEQQFITKVAFLLTPYKERAFDTISIPLGLAWLTAYIKKHIPNIGIDNYDFLLEPELESQFMLLITQGQYSIVGIQAHSNATAHEALRIAKNIKQINSEIIVIVGGNAATFCASYFLSSGFVDFIIYGEGEYTLTELIKSIINNEHNFKKIKGIGFYKNQKIINTGNRELISDLDMLPLPDRDAFSWKKYPQWSIITSRGCPYKCSYCSSTKFWGNQIRFRSADNVFMEIKQLVEKYNVKRFYILDDTFGVNTSETFKLLNAIIENRFEVEWACLTRAEVVSEEMLDLFKAAGCVQVHFGLETANIETQNIIKKRLDIEKLKHMVQHCQKINIRSKLSVIFGLPGETQIHIMKTINFLKELRPNEVQIYPLMPYVGLDILNDSSIYELNKGKHNWKQDALNPLTKSDSLSTDRQIELTRYAIQEFQNIGYKWIPMDLSPDKHDENHIIKTVFAPIQGLGRKAYVE